MTHWKRWTALCVAVAGAIAVVLFIASWDTTSSEWMAERSAAQFALNHSPIERIQHHDVFTGAGAQEVFYGVDAFGHPWYAFVYGNPLTIRSQSAASLLTASAAAKQAKADGLQQPQSEHIGYWGSQAAQSFHVSRGVVWEVYGLVHGGKRAYVYLSATNGKVLWKYVLST